MRSWYFGWRGEYFKDIQEPQDTLNKFLKDTSGLTRTLSYFQYGVKCIGKAIVFHRSSCTCLKLSEIGIFFISMYYAEMCSSTVAYCTV